MEKISSTMPGYRLNDYLLVIPPNEELRNRINNERKTFNKIRLIPDTAKLSPIEVDTSCNEFAIWGVVTYSIHTP